MKIEGSVFQVENAQTYEKDDTKCSGREDLPRKVPNRASKAQIAVTSEISSVVGAFAQIPQRSGRRHSKSVRQRSDGTAQTPGRRLQRTG